MTSAAANGRLRHGHGRALIGSLGCEMDRGANARIGCAPAEIRHRPVDVLIGRLRMLFEQRDGRHDHPRLTIAALRDVERDPGLLHRMTGIARQALDGGDLPALRGADGQHAGAHRRAVEMHRAGAAGTDAAAELASGQPQDARAPPTAAERRPARRTSAGFPLTEKFTGMTGGLSVRASFRPPP